MSHTSAPGILTDQFASSSGDIAFGEVGSGPDVVLVHGTPTSHIIWEGVVARLQDRYRFHLLDLPGYGRSAKFEGQEVRLRSLARALAEWVGSRELDRPVLVGHDFGAAAVLGAHLVEDLATSGICVIDGVVLSPWGTTFSRHVKEHEETFAAVPGYVHEATLRAHLATAFARTPEPDTIDRLIEPWLDDTGQRAYYRQVGQFDYEYTDRLEDLYPTMEVPTLILWGEEDTWVEIDVGRRLQKLIPDARMSELTDAGHFGMLEVPGQVSKHLDTWLASLTGG